MLKVEFYGDAKEVISDMRLFLSMNPLTEAAGRPAEPIAVTGALETSAEAPVEGDSQGQPEEPKKNDTAARKFGESDWDKARRTKEQMATDKEIEELASALEVEIDKTVPADRLVMQLREQSAAGSEKANISSSPEDRKDPAEEALTGEIVEDVSLEDVRQKLGEYAEKFGMAEAQKSGPKLLGAAKLSEIPDTNEARKAAYDNLTAAIEADING